MLGRQLPARQRRLSGSPTWSPTAPRRCTATRSATSASTWSRAPPGLESAFGVLELTAGDYVDHPDLGDLPAVPVEQPGPTADRRGRPATSVRPSATCRCAASSWSTPRTASATCAAPTEPLLVDGTDVEVYVQHRVGAGSPGPGTSTRTTRSTWWAGTAACTRGRSPSTTSSRSPAGCTSRRRCTRPSRDPNFVICSFVPRKVDYHPQAIPVPYNHHNVDSDEVLFYTGGNYEARRGSGIGRGRSRCTRRVHPRPPAGCGGAVASAWSTSTSWRS